MARKVLNSEELEQSEIELIHEFTRIRNKEKISQRKISSDTGIAQSTVTRIETYISKATLKTFIKMLNVLGYHLEIKKNK